MKVFVLAGGLGTRLRELAGDRPKPMIPIRGKPFLTYVIVQLREQGYDDLILCVGHKSDQIQDYFGDGSTCGVHIDYAVESAPLGTGGAIHNARRFIDGSFLVLNGDTFLRTDLNALVEHHARSPRSRPIGTIAIQAAQHTEGRGIITLDARRDIRSFQEKVAVGMGWVNAGAYVLEPAILEFVPDAGPVSLEREVFPAVLSEGRRLQGFEVTGRFIDIGTPEGYHQFCQYIEETSDDHSK
jgi:NDP-sugar pyrophosphorylase family protein